MQIQLTQEQMALVSPEDFEVISQFRWHAVRCGNHWYARRSVKSSGRVTVIQMHRQLMQVGSEEKRFVDHINGNGLDNRRENLRLVTHSENNCNRHKIKSSTGFIGVYPQANGYVVRIRCNEKNYYVGFYENLMEAAFYANQKLDEIRKGFGPRNTIDYQALLATLNTRREAIDKQINIVTNVFQNIDI